MHAVCPVEERGGLSTINLKKFKMKTFDVKGFKREAVGKKDSKKLRADGNVPCVLYGGEEPVHFYVNSKVFLKLLYTPNVYLLNLDVDGEVTKAIIQDAQFHAVEDEVLHVDFLKISDGKPVKIDVPIKVTGYAKGMKAGGKLKVNLRRLRVKALAENLPDTIPVAIDNLEIGQSVRVGELEMENIEFLNSKSVPVASIVVTRAAKAAAGTDENIDDAEGGSEEATADEAAE